MTTQQAILAHRDEIVREDLLGCRVDIATNDALHRRIRDRVLAEACRL